MTQARPGQLVPEAQAILEASPIRAAPIVQIDPPEHTRLRSSITRALSGQRIAALEPRLRGFCDRLIDGFEPRGRADFMADFAHPYPIMVIGSLLGVPEADFPDLLRLSDEHLALVYAEVPPSEQARHAQSTLELHRYIFGMAERRRLAPGDDLISDLFRSVEAGQASLSSDEVASMLYVVLLAGFETTIKLLGNCLLALLAERRHWQAIVDDPARIPAVVEEVLRFDGPVLCTIRMTREDVDLGGTAIPAGSRVQVLMASANHDQAVFPEGEAFDPSRERPAGHLGFGFGVHFCIGAPLARLETRVALEQLARRLPRLRLVPDQQLEYKANLILRGLSRLLVEWDATM